MQAQKMDLIRYTDSDFEGSLDDRKITSGFLFHLGSIVISRASTSIEVEYVKATSPTCQAMWLRRVLDGLKHKQQGSITIWL